MRAISTGFFSQPQTAAHLMFGYFASGEFVSFYIAQYGFDALLLALERIGAGASAVGALREASGVSARVMDERFMEHLGNRCAPLRVVNTAFRQKLDAGARAVAAKNWEGAERLFLEAHALYPDYTAADAPLRQWATASIARGDPAWQREALKKLVAWDAAAHDACLTLSAFYMQDRDWTSAKDVLNRALGVRPFHVEMLKRRAEVHRSLADWGRGHCGLAAVDLLGRPGARGSPPQLGEGTGEKGRGGSRKSRGAVPVGNRAALLGRARDAVATGGGTRNRRIDTPRPTPFGKR